MRYNETLNIHEFPKRSKLDIALHQLEVAIRLFVDERDYVCSATLAGASEEILGKLLEKQGKPSSLNGFVAACLNAGKLVHNEDWDKKEFVSFATQYRNDLKHLTNGEDVIVFRDAAAEIIDRAIDNYWELTYAESDGIRRYMAEAHGL